MKYEVFGSTVPFAEPSWYKGHHTPYYTPSHVAFRRKVRDFVEREILPVVNEWEEKHIRTGWELPKALWRKAWRRRREEGSIIF